MKIVKALRFASWSFWVYALFLSHIIQAADFHEPRSFFYDAQKKGPVYRKGETFFAIIIPSFNNRDFYKKNLDSILCQNYPNYHIYYYDDASPDGTGELVRQHIKKRGVEHRVTLVCNKERQGQMANRYNAIHSCPDNAVAVEVDGDDWLFGPEVLTYLDAMYQTNDVWMTYGQYLNYPSMAKGYSRKIPHHVIENNSFRRYGWVASHLRTSRVWLFKKIKVADLLYEGTFFRMGTDIAAGMPRLEMAGWHSQYIDEILYVYNRGNPNTCAKTNLEFQLKMDRAVRSRKAYAPFYGPKVSPAEQHKNSKADLIIFSQDRNRLFSVVSAATKNLSGIDTISVITHEAQQTVSEMEKALQKHSLRIRVFRGGGEDFLDAFKKAIGLAGGFRKHIILMSDEVRLWKHVDASRCIQDLERTFAHEFYLYPPTFVYEWFQNNVPFVSLTGGVVAWQFRYGNSLLFKQGLRLGLFRKNDVLRMLKGMKSNSFDSFQREWANRKVDENEVGLILGKSLTKELEVAGGKDGL